jgi:hypothetical protein
MTRRGRRNALVASIEAIPAAPGLPKTALADSGYANGGDVVHLTKRGIGVLMATGATGHRRVHDVRPSKAKTPPKEPKAEWLKSMADKLSSEEGRALYKLRQQTVEPVFGIIKVVLRFTRFSVQGQDKVANEWCLDALAYNCKRLHKLQPEIV